MESMVNDQQTINDQYIDDQSVRHLEYIKSLLIPARYVLFMNFFCYPPIN
jgi:hypothetical protein